MQTECIRRYPPGKEIYRKLSLSLYEVDGREQKVSTTIEVSWSTVHTVANYYISV